LRTRVKRRTDPLDLATQLGKTVVVVDMRAHAYGLNQGGKLFAQLVEPLAKDA
jgi:hypothetical protein